jgi:hypothetical protein
MLSAAFVLTEVVAARPQDLALKLVENFCILATRPQQ